MEKLSALSALLRTSGVSEEMLAYKCAVMVAIYNIQQSNMASRPLPTYTDIAKYVGMYSKMHIDTRFDRNIVYALALLRSEQLVKRVALHDEDVYKIDDDKFLIIAKIIDPNSAINECKVTAGTNESTQIEQSILLTPPEPKIQSSSCIII